MGYIYWEASLPQGKATCVASIDYLKNVSRNGTEFTVSLEISAVFFFFNKILLSCLCNFFKTTVSVALSKCVQRVTERGRMCIAWRT